jgi:glycosyltransferase involved in cell wall biosynthesis
MARPGTPRRGFKTLIAALELISQRLPDTQLRLFGDDLSTYDIPFTYSDCGVIADAGKMAELYSKSSIFIDASEFQGFGRTALEAMACGAVCILTNQGGVTEYARDDVNSILVPPNAPEAILVAYLHLAKDPELLAEIIENGASTAAEFSHKSEAKKTHEYFLEIMENAGSK